MADKLNTSGTMQWIRADRLTVDPRYQRPINRRKVRKIAAEFDADKFHVLAISKRDDGTHVILDGQQRWNAIVGEMNYGDQQVPCMVYVGLSIEEEAALFAGYNDLRTKPRPMDMHRANVVAGQKRAVTIERVLHVRGLSALDGPGAGRVQAIGAMNQVYDQAGVKVLERTLDVLMHAYGMKSDAFQGEIMIAVAVIFARHGASIDDGRMVRALSRLNPKDVLTAARKLKCELAVGGSNVGRSQTVVAGIILKAYNYRLAEDARIYFDTEKTGMNYWKADAE